MNPLSKLKFYLLPGLYFTVLWSFYLINATLNHRTSLIESMNKVFLAHISKVIISFSQDYSVFMKLMVESSVGKNS